MSSTYRWKDGRESFQQLSHGGASGANSRSLFGLGASGQFRGPGSVSADLGWGSWTCLQSQGLGFVSATCVNGKVSPQWQL